ncbi:PREDICTED: tapasin-related protein-like [Haliaeetus leucocephalus]|uniref:tapasin-related protein-like n=1 Tax=Haliaeetus leucocephalus TaxID=52644 RepID=UPI00053CAB50|nr:PREDICTED: tapasin-related protein-like [Haliaeetus leucocephalus]
MADECRVSSGMGPRRGDSGDAGAQPSPAPAEPLPKRLHLPPAQPLAAGTARWPLFLLLLGSGTTEQVERVARRAEMVLEEIPKGNASLVLRDAEVREEGTYWCLVSVASLAGVQSIQLQIEEKPTVTINITSLSLVEGEQHKLGCNIRHYYPHNTQAQWLQEPKDTWKVPDVMKNVLSSGDPQSSNGTYSSSRCFLLTASLKDGGHKYTCWVDHPSLQSPIRRSVTTEVRGTPLTWGHCPLHP